MNSITKAITAACLAAGMLSCTPTKNLASRIDTSIECEGICTRYATCYDPTYTVNACEENCENKAQADGNFRRQADACNECMTETACVQTTAQCGSECRSVVPMPPVTSKR